VRVDVLFHPTDQGPSIASVAVAAEEAGLGAIWVPDHSHIPLGRSTPRGGRVGASPLPEHYGRLLDQFIALTVAAEATTTLGLGTGVTVVSQRDPIYLAKQVATLDHISNGRVQFGVGYGWNRDEMRAHGIDVDRRRTLVSEKLRACKELWTSIAPEMHGDFVDFGPCAAWPKPVQRPHPPIVIGASPTERHFHDLVELADGWLPIDDGRYPIRENWARLLRIAEDDGRDPAELSLGAVVPAPNSDKLVELCELGASYAVVNLPVGPEAAVQRAIESCHVMVNRLAAD
jgi:probable F420-dependent oxidoreductase